MTLRLAFLAAAVLLSGCAGMDTEVLIGRKLVDHGFYGAGPTITLRARKQVSERTFCEYEHKSYLFAGRPFGPGHEEDSLDQIGCGLRFGAQP